MTIHEYHQSTISRSSPAAREEAQMLALQALGWTLGDEDRAHRLLALTGLAPDALRNSLEDDTVLLAVLDFLASHEPDLLACAETLAIDPAMLMHARNSLADGEIG